eukprot:scaffold69309_cov65-Phaeocystis_antarctica.AAC.21
MGRSSCRRPALRLSLALVPLRLELAQGSNIQGTCPAIHVSLDTTVMLLRKTTRQPPLMLSLSTGAGAGQHSLPETMLVHTARMAATSVWAVTVAKLWIVWPRTHTELIWYSSCSSTATSMVAASSSSSSSDDSHCSFSSAPSGAAAAARPGGPPASSRAPAGA